MEAQLPADLRVWWLLNSFPAYYVTSVTLALRWARKTADTATRAQGLEGTLTNTPGSKIVPKRRNG